jgi:hypothetical protein
MVSLKRFGNGKNNSSLIEENCEVCETEVEE